MVAIVGRAAVFFALILSLSAVLAAPYWSLAPAKVTVASLTGSVSSFTPPSPFAQGE
jgi:hypothetical protein